MNNMTMNDLENKQMAAELVCKAIADLDESKGSTMHDIKNYINQEYKISPQVFKELIIPTLKNGVTFGAITNSMGHYRLSNLMDNIVDLACRKRDGKEGRDRDRTFDRSRSSGGGCSPKRKCQRSSKNFRRIDYKSADVSYEDRDNKTGDTPRACVACPRK